LYEASETRRLYGSAHARGRGRGRGRARAHVASTCAARDVKTTAGFDMFLTLQPAMRGRIMAGSWCAPKVSGRLALRFGFASVIEGIDLARKTAMFGPLIARGSFVHRARRQEPG